MSDLVTHRIPASTSNIGPGFDCLGIALALYNTVTVVRGGEAPCGEPKHPMAAECAGCSSIRLARGCSRFGVGAFRVRCRPAGDLGAVSPLGGSASFPGSTNSLVALSVGRGFSLFAPRIEGNPDNAAPSSFGGFVLTDARGKSFRFEVGTELKFVLLIPELEVLTTSIRRVLPAAIPHRDAVVDSGNACMITAAFATRRYEMLTGCFGDTLHQPWRAPLVPGLFEVIVAGERAGALGELLRVTVPRSAAWPSPRAASKPSPTRCSLHG